MAFESSTDSVAYSPLGKGTRVSGGWRLTGLDLPRSQNLTIRARGTYGTGWYGGSESIVELVRAVYLRPTIYLPLVRRCGGTGLGHLCGRPVRQLP